MLWLLAAIYDGLARLFQDCLARARHRWILIQGEVFADIPIWVSFTPRNPALFTGLNIAMGVTLIIGDGNIDALGPLGYVQHWDIVYGVAFLFAGFWNALSLLRWRSMTADTYIRLRVWASGAGMTVTLGWLLLEAANAFMFTSDWTRVWPWAFVLVAKLITAERVPRDAHALPEYFEELKKIRQELDDERR